MARDNSMRMQQPNPISDGVAGTTCFTQLTITTGAVFNVETTARVAPVSLMLLVKTMMAPERIEYFVNGSIMDLNTPNGLAPKVLAASSMSRLMRSNAAVIDLTKYGYVIAKCANTRSKNSGTKAKLCQKNFKETPRAIEGTIKGTLIRISNTVEVNFPNLFLAIIIAMGNPITKLSSVTIPANAYDKAKLCQ
jgi:hypothetical protein